MNTPTQPTARATHAGATTRASWRLIRELNGAVADLGVLLPYTLGVVITGILAPAAVFAGLGCAYLLTALIYRLPIAVQPMKAIGAVALANGLDAAQIMLSGVILGVTLLALGASGLVRSMARAIPQSVTAGLQLGLGLMLAVFALSLIAQAPIIAVCALLILFAFSRSRAAPGALIVVLGASCLQFVFGGSTSAGAVLTAALNEGWVLPSMPTWNDLTIALGNAVLPQLPLTLVNAIIVTAAVARDLFPENASRANETRLAYTSGSLNLLLTPLGALPICHGASGLAAHHRFGARSGLGTGLLGVVLLLLATLPTHTSIAMLSLVPVAVLGALLMFSAKELAVTPRLFDATPSCKVVIAVTAAVTLASNPALGLVVGWISDVARRYAIRRYFRARDATPTRRSSP